LLTYGYGDANAGTYTSAKVSSQINRMDRLTWDATRVAVFGFTAAGRTDKRTYWKGADAGDTVATTDYTFDALGRLTEIHSADSADTTIVDFVRAYDYNGNPNYTQYAHKTTRSELYGTQTGASPEGPADALNRLTRFRRGTLDGNKTDVSVSVFEQDWHDSVGALRLDKLGNWDAMRLDPDGDDTPSSMTTTWRGHNDANEYTSLGGAGAYDHNNNDNLTDDETNTYYYDFANHLVCAVRESDSSTIAEYVCDALGQRVEKEHVISPLAAPRQAGGEDGAGDHNPLARA